MEDAEIALMFSLLVIPVAIWLQLWVKRRREDRRNSLGEEEFENTARAFSIIRRCCNYRRTYHDYHVWCNQIHP